MTDSPADSLSISGANSPPAVTVTLKVGDERTTVSMDPAEAVLAGSQLMAEAQRLLPKNKEFSVRRVPARASAPPPPSPGPFREPRAVPEPPPVPVELDATSLKREDIEPVPRNTDPILVPPGYESFLGEVSPEQWRVTRSAQERGEVIGVTPEEMILAASEPDDIERPNSTVRAHVRGNVSVLVPDADPDAIIGVTLVNRSPEDYEDHSPARKRAPSGGPGRKMPGGFSEVRQMLLAHGFEIDEHHKGHPKVRHPKHPNVMVTLPGSPSDHRSFLNMIARIRREFGVDITQRP